MAHPRIAAWICFVCLVTLLLASCAVEPSDAQPAAAPSPVIETIAPAGAADAASTAQAPDETPTDRAAEALPVGPDRLAALGDPRGAVGALLTPEQLAGSASTFAQFTGLEGLTASQPELREGDPDFLARTILFVNSGGEQVGMVVAIDENRQIYFWIDEAGNAICQYTDQTQLLEGEACATAIAQYWDTTIATHQEQAAAAEAEPTQSWTVYTAEDIASALASPESKIRDQARFVLGADRLSDEAFATELGGRMAEITTEVDVSSRTNVVVFVCQTNLDDVVAAVTAAREQGLKLLGSTLLYVTHDEGGAMRIWHTGTFTDRGSNSWISASYQGLQTFMGFFSYNPDDGRVTFQDLGKDNYWLLGMGSREDFAKSRIEGPAQFEYRLQINPDGSSTVLTVSKLGKEFEFIADATSPRGYTWKSYATPDMRENGAAEIMPSLDKIKVVISQLDTITAQSAELNWHEADLLDYQGSKYLEIRDTRQDRVAYLVYVEVNDTTGERQYGPVVLVNSGNFDPSSKLHLITIHQPLSSQLARDTLLAIATSGLYQVMRDNNIMVIGANSNLPPTHQSSNIVGKELDRKLPINRILFNLDLVDSDPTLQARTALITVIAETFEVLGHMYFIEGVTPPSEGFFFRLHPQANQALLTTDGAAFLHNTQLNALDWARSNLHLFSEPDQQALIGDLVFSVESFNERIGIEPAN